jgi:hypothetical protein
MTTFSNQCVHRAQRKVSVIFVRFSVNLQFHEIFVMKFHENPSSSGGWTENHEASSRYRNSFARLCGYYRDTFLLICCPLLLIWSIMWQWRYQFLWFFTSKATDKGSTVCAKTRTPYTVRYTEWRLTGPFLLLGVTAGLCKLSRICGETCRCLCDMEVVWDGTLCLWVSSSDVSKDPIAFSFMVTQCEGGGGGFLIRRRISACVVE